jgi:hypothetical protein
MVDGRRWLINALLLLVVNQQSQKVGMEGERIIKRLQRRARDASVAHPPALLALRAVWHSRRKAMHSEHRCEQPCDKSIRTELMQIVAGRVAELVAMNQRAGHPNFG